ncbi:Ig-like domain-containing protein [Mucilaginibacter sp. KACC 22063]|uniref:Ig-like domain-containing protein n=1 Tax=Mucilaginibacter sp. KACC 22063 TaxID=3025666 RepID=UPI00236716AE|nr:Ig-like domain-containing protein [Mucilaginibacter sp. KACC 22063]WDF55438.1 Ig-like domain-containing protein [Mucilaginibacter sp. KACC 22063]
MQRPQGGPRDRTPPKLLKAVPENMTRNFNAKSIELEFDEYFKLTNQYQEISVSPSMEKIPEYKIRQKKLVIDFKDSLQKNTTYVINFGKAIADVNEGNVLKNFTYVFSTGPHIDSLSVSGSVTNLETQEKEKDATVMLFPIAQDSAYFGKKKPMIYTTTDSSGNFSLNNLHSGKYRIYALKETAVNRIYDNDNELIAFLKNPIDLQKDTSNVALTLFKQTPEKFRLTENKFDADGKLSFVFNKPLLDPSIKIAYPPNIDESKYVEFSQKKDSAQVYLKNMNFDSLRVVIYDKNIPLDTIVKRKGLKETFTRNITLKYNLDGDNRLKPGTDLQLTSSLPVESFDQQLMILNEDSAAVNYSIQKNAANPKILNLKYRWKQGSNYELIINENALTDIYGDKNKKFIKKFSINKPENYGTLTLRLNVSDTTTAYIAEVLNEQKKLIRTQAFTKSTPIVLKDYPTGKYRVRIIYDNNRNGIWDSGSVKRKTYPEKIWIYNKDITLRANWETEEIIEVPKESTLP